ncbi:MAG: AlpA family phage regulatory protein [Phyllobacteriaceae bacterium]|nr:AlpA family phage regulatory protein [Phyllobacteriaceae bacterium]
MPAPDRIIRMETVRARTGLSRSTIYRKIKEGTFPPQLRISIHGAGWRESDINSWVANPVTWRATNDNEAPDGKVANHDAG